MHFISAAVILLASLALMVSVLLSTECPLFHNLSLSAQALLTFCINHVLKFIYHRGCLNHKVRHPRCVCNKLDWSLCTCLTQLYGGTDMYNLLHKEQLHVSALFIGHLQVDK